MKEAGVDVAATASASPTRATVEGRVLLSRHGICTTFGVGRATAERWWRHRATNGHPAVAWQQGRRQWWDEQAMRTFVNDLAASPPDRLDDDEETVLTRAALARRFHVSVQHLANLYSARDDTGHPRPARRIGRHLYWSLGEMDSWWQHREATKRDSLTSVDHSGNGDDLLTLDQAAAVLGYTDASVIRGYLARSPGYFPRPDWTDPHGRRHYLRRTVWAFADSRTRPGRAGRPRPGAPG
ncbi:hypothetical protein WHI96_27230 [Pseudonocardia tropica]|uniref:Helix-turn-helix domain-containing protein n=1 Tax=Pseudonocardia tropica TaxID=681289 RepID=A0ABV1K3N9_9PSEU